MQTRSPTRKPSTAAPIAATTPLTSWPCAAAGCSQNPFQLWRSLPQIPQRTISTRREPGPGAGSVTSSTSIRLTPW